MRGHALSCKTELLPIAVLSCRRPVYLKACLDGLSASLKSSHIRYSVALFQDLPMAAGDKSAEKIAEECTDIFSNAFPEGTIFSTGSNLGISGNYSRAERWAFGKNFQNSESYALAALFIEDDFVLNDSSVRCINSLLDLIRLGFAVGAVSVAGHIHELAPGAIRPMGQLWAYALSATAYTCVRNKLEAYDRIVLEHRAKRTQQYPPLDLCLELASKWGYEPQAGDRDSFLALALHCEGFLQVASKGVVGKYIGIDGESFDKDQYEMLGWSNQEEISEVPCVEAIIESFLRQQALLRNHQEDQFSKANPLFYSDACADAYAGGRFQGCRRIAQIGLCKWGSFSSRGYPFSFERHLLGSLVRIGQTSDAYETGDRIATAGQGTWGLWAVATALEDAGMWDESVRCWSRVLAYTPNESRALERLNRAAIKSKQQSIN